MSSSAHHLGGDVEMAFLCGVCMFFPCLPGVSFIGTSFTKTCNFLVANVVPPLLVKGACSEGGELVGIV